ncbi:MAG: peptide chain release factor 2 [Deferribacterota bacterium]|nr:peptide chain release factor 2 [Deferribacterota bacterium]
MIDEILVHYEELHNKFKQLNEVFNEKHITERVKHIDKMILEDPHFYNKEESKQFLKEQMKLKKLLEQWSRLKELYEDVGVLIELLEEGNNDVEKELIKTNKILSTFLKDFEIKMILNNENDESDAIVTIHSGAGGTEANDWASMLSRMYIRWVENKGYKYKVLDLVEGDKVGIKSITFNVYGPYSYGYLKSESGVHRLVRLSPFDTNNKRHTSFASVFVLPDIEDTVEIDINESDLKIETFRSSGAGGQHVNKTDSAVRITHEPTGIVVSCQNERSQYQNKANALKILKAKLYELELEKKKREKDKIEESKDDIGWGNQIRTYVLHPYKMVKDLRTKVESPNPEDVLDGNIDAFIISYLQHEAKRSNS